MDNYTDYVHYASDICTQIMVWMKNGEYELTEETYMEYIDKLVCQRRCRQRCLPQRPQHYGIHHVHADGDKALQRYRHRYGRHRAVESPVPKIWPDLF